MTPFRNDEDNPFGRASVWPKMPQAPMSLGPLPRATRPAFRPVDAEVAEVAAAAAEAEMAIPGLGPAPEPEREPEFQPIDIPIGLRRAVPVRKGVRLTPLIAAAAVGAGGAAAIFLMLGVRPAASPAPARATVAVGDMMGKSAAAPTVALPAVTPPAAAPNPAPRLALAASTRRRESEAAHPLAAPLLAVPAAAAEPVAIPLQLPPATPTPAPAAAPYVPPPPRDPNAPIATHVPD